MGANSECDTRLDKQCLSKVSIRDECDMERSLGITVHCLAVFCLCHLHRFPSGHRQHLSFFVCLTIKIPQG